ncbi:molybdate ABC transporter permease subunit [Paenibacillus kribbensis]|uniref:molybdate ABC transporter permease subunit n=1 Tax=Paenibacillus kribbensis TaxID=172713 RepID=UPI002DBACDEB|nr:molybdate ABC transporter permease subunit [Paenibacillus kribbensis]MEC0238156.1 molybdate ABC transporter permease subunit [Paenibacillus kribbensis]
MTAVNWAEFWPPVQLSLQVASLSCVIVLVLGVLAARWIKRSHIRGKLVLETIFMLPLVLPPTVVGFLLLVILGRRSWLGQWIEWLFHASVIFSWWAAVLASIVVAFPLVYQTMKTAFDAVDRSLEDSARSAGAGEWQVFRYITLPLSYPSLLTAAILGFARSLGEFGATLMIAGNIPNKTQTVPTAIYVAVDAGNQTMAWAWTIAIVLVSFIMLLVARRKT